jgi:hypothetical protein
MKITKHFAIEEIVHPEYIEDHGRVKMVNVFKRYAPLTLEGLETLREWVDESIIINDYKYGGSFINSGLRHPNFPLGSPLSAHYFMLAMDCKFKNRSVKDVQQDILNNQDAHPLITRMEDYRDTPTWLHVQFGLRPKNETIKVFRP